MCYESQTLVVNWATILCCTCRHALSLLDFKLYDSPLFHFMLIKGNKYDSKMEKNINTAVTGKVVLKKHKNGSEKLISPCAKYLYDLKT